MGPASRSQQVGSALWALLPGAESYHGRLAPWTPVLKYGSSQGHMGPCECCQLLNTHFLSTYCA